MKNEWSQSAVEGYGRRHFAESSDFPEQGSGPRDLPELPVLRDLPDLPGVPARIGTRIALEIMLQEPVIDLRAISAVIVADLGATVEVLRLAAREEAGAERAERIEDALAGVSLSDVQEATARAPFDSRGRLSACWDHAHRTAIEMHSAAMAHAEVRPEQAWIVGLLHELGRVPGLLGWTLPGVWRGQAQGARLAEYWRLPRFLVSALCEIETRRTSSVWVSLLETAHRRMEDGSCSVYTAAPRPARSRVLHFGRTEWKAQGSARPSIPA